MLSKPVRHKDGNTYQYELVGNFGLSYRRTPRYPVGTELNGRVVKDIRVSTRPNTNPAIGKRFKYTREWLLECLTCQRQTWVSLWMKDANKVPTCTYCLGASRRTNFCEKCGNYLTRGSRNKTRQCGKCYKPKWTLEKWLDQNRPYRDLLSCTNNKKQKTRKYRKLLAGDYLYAEQKGLCKFCSSTMSRRGSHIDHCHETDRVRGLVHPLCNGLLGVLDACVKNGSLLPSIPQIVKGFYAYMGL
jgi:hypothetical protein